MGHSPLAIVLENTKICFKQDSSLSLILLKSQQDEGGKASDYNNSKNSKN